jgi:hypothetical protein
MTIWILAILLFALFGALGYAKGAVRMTFPLIGLVLALFLSVPLGPTVRPLIPLVGLKNPVWSWLLPPVMVFFAIALVFIIVGFIVHRQVNLYYKYRTDDYHRLSWERLNKRLGVCIGLAAGAGYTLLLGLVIHILGYLTVQVSAGDNDSALLRYLNKARVDLQESGMDKTVTAFDPTPERYYQAADVLGLIYHNHPLKDRMGSYPPFLALSERQEFQDMATDTEFQNLWATQATVGQMVNHPKTQAVLGNPEILQELEKVDLKDLLGYLQTGQSEKYAELRILGRWQLDPYATLLQVKKKRQRITSAEMRVLRQQVELVKGVSLVALPDNSAKLKGPDVFTLMKKYLGDLTRSLGQGGTAQAPTVARAAAPAPSQPAPPTSAADRATRERYGLNRPGATAPPPVAAAPAAVAPSSVPAPPSPAQIAAEIAALPTIVLAQGTWKGDGDHYQMEMQAQADGFKFDTGKKSASVEASIRDGKLYLSDGNETMVMVRM